MTKAPAFQFYAAEYLADMNVQLLTLEQEGAYIRLLAFCWREGKVPNDDIRLAALCKGCKVSILGVVKSLFQVSEDGSFLFHKRLEKERAKHEAFRDKQAVNGSKGGRPVKPTITQAFTKAEGLANPNESSAFASSTSSAKTTTKTFASTADAVTARGSVLGSLPLTGGRFYKVCEDDLARDKPLYPGVDVEQEYREMRGWLLANPKKRKTPNGIRNFMNNWLARAQDNQTPGASNGTFKGKTGHSVDAATRAIQEIEDSYASNRLGDQETGEVGRGGLQGLRSRPRELRDSGPGSGDEGIVLEASR